MRLKFCYRRSANRRNGAYAPYQANPEYAYRYRRAVSEDRGEGEISKEEAIMRGKSDALVSTHPMW